MQPSSFRGLAISGGGVAEVACGGALRVWVRAGNTLSQFTDFAGTSAGAIVATMLAMRASIDVIEETLSTADFSSFVDTSIFDKIRDAYEFWNAYGWNSGDGLEIWIRDMIQKLAGNKDTTFQQAYTRFGTRLIITKTDLLYPECRSVTMDYQSHPNEMIREAVTTSCRIPLFFQAAFKDGHVFVDGGVLMNYPLRALYKYLKPEECMGISLRSEPGTLVLKPVESYENFITSIVNAWLRASTEQHIKEDDWKRTCSIHVTLSAVDFHAEKPKIDEAIKQGELAMAVFLKSLQTPSLEDIIKEKDRLLAERDVMIAKLTGMIYGEDHMLK
jgi:NTE family protein